MGCPIKDWGRGVVVGNLDGAPSNLMADCAANDVQIARGDYYAMNGTADRTPMTNFINDCNSNGITPVIWIVGIDNGHKATKKEMLDAADWLIDTHGVDLGLFSEPWDGGLSTSEVVDRYDHVVSNIPSATNVVAPNIGNGTVAQRVADFLNQISARNPDSVGFSVYGAAVDFYPRTDDINIEVTGAVGSEIDLWCSEHGSGCANLEPDCNVDREWHLRDSICAYQDAESDSGDLPLTHIFPYRAYNSGDNYEITPHEMGQVYENHPNHNCP